MSTDPRVEDARRHYQALHGEKPPVTPEEANSRNPSTPSDHSYDSIMEGADIGVASYLEQSDRDPVADGGFEYQRVFDGEVEVPSGHPVSVSKYGNGKTAVRGSRREVDDFVNEVRQQLGAEDVDGFFDSRIHDYPVAADGSGHSEKETLAAVDHGRSYDEVQATMERGADVENERDIATDGGERSSMPYGGMPSLSEVRNSEDQKGSMSEFPM